MTEYANPDCYAANQLRRKADFFAGSSTLEELKEMNSAMASLRREQVRRRVEVARQEQEDAEAVKTPEEKQKAKDLLQLVHDGLMKLRGEKFDEVASGVFGVPNYDVTKTPDADGSVTYTIDMSQFSVSGNRYDAKEALHKEGKLDVSEIK